MRFPHGQCTHIVYRSYQPAYSAAPPHVFYVAQNSNTVPQKREKKRQPLAAA